MKVAKDTKKKKFDINAWVSTHFEEIVDKYGGRYVLIIDKKIYPVNEDNIIEVDKRLRKKYGIPPIGLPVPRAEDFVHILIW